MVRDAKANSQNVTAPRDGKTVYVGSDWKEVTYRTMKETIKQLPSALAMKS